MGRTLNRGYKRGEAFRDARLFMIVAEGEREDEYFTYFKTQSLRLKIAIVPREAGASSPKFFIDRITNYMAGKYDVTLLAAGDDSAPEKYDALWFVLDVDKWPREQVEELNSYCEDGSNWSIAVSNPCFEVWLHNHYKEIDSPDLTAHDLKQALSKLRSGGYSVDHFAPRIQEAADRSRNLDSHPDFYFPVKGVTKVYLLAEQLLRFLKK